jgi:hypothetical protein
MAFSAHSISAVHSINAIGAITTEIYWIHHGKQCSPMESNAMQCGQFNGKI